MKYFFNLLSAKTKKEQSGKSPVYAFFAEASADVKTKAYKKALKSASEDQMHILSRYDKEFVHTN